MKYIIHTALFLGLPIFVFTGCAEAMELAKAVGGGMPGIPDPKEVVSGNISATQFWMTWGGMMLAHEGRKILRDWMNRKKRNGGGND